MISSKHSPGGFMNVQRHTRIAHIKKLSGFLSSGLKFAQYAIWLFLPVILTMPFSSGNLTLKLGESLIAPADVTQSQRMALAAGLGVMLVLTLLIIRYLRQLMEQFSEGRVFDGDAIRIARKAVNCALALYLFKVVLEIAGVIYSGKFQIPGPALTVFYGIFYFGLVQVMLWALEVGRDLSDESELTI
jgi:hypothetical protein